MMDQVFMFLGASTELEQWKILAIFGLCYIFADIAMAIKKDFLRRKV